MRKITEAERERIWAEVRREFPADEMMQELHFVRRLHELQTEGMSPAERIRFYDTARKAPVSDDTRVSRR